jgi:hypothetical protein
MYKKILLLVLAGIFLTACATQQPYGYPNTYGYSDTGYNPSGNRHSNALIGGGVGAVAGAAMGTAFGGDDLTNAGLGALAGGAVGAAVGAYVDHQQNRQAQRQQNAWQQEPYDNYYGNE